jgi:hypothetical protein
MYKNRIRVTSHVVGNTKFKQMKFDEVSKEIWLKNIQKFLNDGRLK